MSDPDSKSETDKDEEEWKQKKGRVMNGGDGGMKTTQNMDQFPPKNTLLNKDGTRSRGNNHNITPLISVDSSAAKLNGNRSDDIKVETAVSGSSNKNIRLPTTGALSAGKTVSHRNRKEAGIPVGIAVAWQRLVTTASESPVHDTVCTTMSSSPSGKGTTDCRSNTPTLVKSSGKIKTPSHSPLPKRPSSTSSLPAGPKDKARHSGNNNDGTVLTDVKHRPGTAHSVPLNPHGVYSASSNSKLSSEHQHYYPYGGLKYTTSEWPAGLNVPQLPQNYSAEAVAYLQHHHQQQQQQQQLRLQQQHQLQQQQQHQLQQQLQQQMSHLSQYGASSPSYYQNYNSPEALHKYEQYILHQRQAELVRHHELQYLHQLHHLSQHQQQQHPEYDTHRATPIPSPRISIPSPSPTSQQYHHHQYHHPNAPPQSPATVTNTTTTTLWQPDIIHHTSATLSPKSLASTPSPVSTQDSFLCNTPKAINMSLGAVRSTTTTTTVPLGASSTSPSGTVDSYWKEIKINPVPKKAVTPTPTTTPTSVIKKCEKLMSPTGMEGEFGVNLTKDEKSITVGKKKHDFFRVESLIEKRDEVSLPILCPSPGKGYNGSAPSHINNNGDDLGDKTDKKKRPGDTFKNGLPDDDQKKMKEEKPAEDFRKGLSSSDGVNVAPPVKFEYYSQSLSKGTTTTVKTEIKSEANGKCDVPQQVYGVSVKPVVPEVKINVSHYSPPRIIKTESVNSVATDLTMKKSAQVFPIIPEAPTVTPVIVMNNTGAGSTVVPPSNINKSKKLNIHAGRKEEGKLDYFHKVHKNGVDSTVKSNLSPTTTATKNLKSISNNGNSKDDNEPVNKEPNILAKSCNIKPEPSVISMTATKPIAQSMTLVVDSQKEKKKKEKKPCNNDNYSSLPVYKKEVVEGVKGTSKSGWNSVGTTPPAFIFNNYNSKPIQDDEQSKVETDSLATKCDTDIRLMAPYSSLSPSANSNIKYNSNNSNIIKDYKSDTITIRPEENKSRPVYHQEKEKKKSKKQQQQHKIIGNIKNTNYHHLLNVPLKQSPPSSPTPPPKLLHSPPKSTLIAPSNKSNNSTETSTPTTTTTSTLMTIKIENVGDINTEEREENEDILSPRFHPQHFRPIEAENNHLDLLATVAQEFGNEIGLRKNPFGNSSTTNAKATSTTTTTSATPVTKKNVAFDAYEFKEDERSVPEFHSSNNKNDSEKLATISEEDEESLPSLSHSRSSSPILGSNWPIFQNNSNNNNNFSMGAAVANTNNKSATSNTKEATAGRPTVAPLVLRIPQVKATDPAGTTTTTTATTAKKPKKAKTSKKRKDSENQADPDGITGGVKRKKKKRSSSKDGDNDGERVKAKKAKLTSSAVGSQHQKSENTGMSMLFPLTPATGFSSPSSCLTSSLDRAEKAMKKSKKENLHGFWELNNWGGELKVAPLKLTKRRSTTDAIVMKKGTADNSGNSNLVGNSDTKSSKIKKQRYSIESSSVPPFIWSSSQSSTSTVTSSSQGQQQQKTDRPFQYHHTFGTTTTTAAAVNMNKSVNSNNDSDSSYFSIPHSSDGLSSSTSSSSSLLSGQSSTTGKMRKKKMKKLKQDVKEHQKKRPKDQQEQQKSSNNTLSQDLSNKKTKKMKKKSKKHQDTSFSFEAHYPGSKKKGSAGCGKNTNNDHREETDTGDSSQVFSPASSNVENDWAANPAYAVTAIKAATMENPDPMTTTPILAPCNSDGKNSSKKQHQHKKSKPSKLTLANLNKVEEESSEGGGGSGSGPKQSTKVKQSILKSSSTSSYIQQQQQQLCPPKRVKQTAHHHTIKPCLKAEPIRRSTSSPEHDFISEGEEDENIDINTPTTTTKYSKTVAEDEIPKTGEQTPTTATASAAESLEKVDELIIKEKQEQVKIQGVEQMINDMRILTEIQGLFYTGKLNALQPPDVYGVTLDNERGAPPHIIFSAEEVLEKCIRELKPEPEALVHGLRICAYWSPQYSGLYPGKISPDYVPSGDPYTELIPIEFDDGDTGVIKLNEIRLLSPDHPKGEYDPNPLLTLEKKHRKRRHSSATASQMSGCTGDHEETDCGEAYCAKVGKMEEEEEEREGKGKYSSKLMYWTWKGMGFKRPRSKKDRNKEFFEGIQRGDEVINVGDSALFTSSGNDRPFIGRVEKFWEKKGRKAVKVRWYYHPDEVKTNKAPKGLYAGALFESPHIDENDVQTIAKKCEVLPFAEYKERVGCLSKWSRSTSQRSTYFVTGFYDPYTYKLKLKDLK